MPLLLTLSSVCLHVSPPCDLSTPFPSPPFSPGAPEIDRLVRQLQGSSRLAGAVGRAGAVRVLPLHGGLPPAVQVKGGWGGRGLPCFWGGRRSWVFVIGLRSG